MPARRGQILALFGCRGGAGATSLAIGIGSQLLRAGRSVCIVDMDLQLGDVFVALDLDPQTSLAAVAREAEAIDGAALRRRLAHHNSGLYALTQVGRIDDIDGSLVERMPALMESLAREFDYVIVDGIRDFGDYALSVMDVADQVGLVLTQDVSSVRRAARVITLFRRLGYDATKLALVLNRHARKSQISVQEIERALQMPVTATVRNDYQRVSGAFDEGALLVDVARASGVAKDIATVAGLLAQRAAPGFALLQQQQQGRMPQGYPHQPLNLAAPQKKSFLGGLFKRGGK